MQRFSIRVDGSRLQFTTGDEAVEIETFRAEQQQFYAREYELIDHILADMIAFVKVVEDTDAKGNIDGL